MRPGDHFLIGLYMLKNVKIIERAYNDSNKITEKFNKNILRVINKELDADFNESLFEHHAFFNSEKNRIEMHLKAKQDMAVEIKALNLKIDIEKEETINTEISRKFKREETEKMFEKEGLSVERWLSDPNEWFSLAGMVKK